MYFTIKDQYNSNKDELTIWLDKILKIVKHQSYSNGKNIYYLEITFVSNRSDCQFSWTSQSIRDDYYDRILKAMYAIYPNEENPMNHLLSLKG